MYKYILSIFFFSSWQRICSTFSVANARAAKLAYAANCVQCKGRRFFVAQLFRWTVYLTLLLRRRRTQTFAAHLGEMQFNTQPHNDSFPNKIFFNFHQKARLIQRINILADWKSVYYSFSFPKQNQMKKKSRNGIRALKAWKDYSCACP